MKSSRNISKKWCNTAIVIIAAVLTLSIVPPLASALTCDCGDICVNETGWWHSGSEFNASNTPIQAAVNNATAGSMIYVYNGTYKENVDVNKRLTLRGEGADVVNVTNSTAGQSVFEVTADYMNISGFNVSGATGDWKAGIYLSTDVDHCNISDNIVSGNYHGIYLDYLNNNNMLMNNTASNNSYGILLDYSSNNILTNNTASNNGRGIYLSSSSNITLMNNTMSGNEYNFGIYGNSLYRYTHKINTSNKIEDKPIYYWVDQKNQKVPDNAGFVGVINSTNITVRDLKLTKNSEGVLFAYTTNSRIVNVNASDNREGIYLYSSSNNTLADNTALDNYYGICLGSSSNNTLTNNIVNLNNYDGIRLSNSSSNILTNNTVLDNNDGIWLYDSSNNNMLMNNTVLDNNEGIWLYDSSSNILTNNAANSNDDYGICLSFSSSNILMNNTVNLNNNEGIYLKSSSNNTLVNNTALNNDEGISLFYSGNNTLTTNIVSNSYDGISLSYSSNNTLTNNTASNNSEGTSLFYSGNNTLTTNIASDNFLGIYLESSSNYNMLTNNTASNNSYGIYLRSSSNNTLTNNTMSGNTCNFGIYAANLSEYTHDIDTNNTVDGKPIYYRIDRQDEQIPGGAGFVGVVNSTNITVRDIVLTNNHYGILMAYTNDSKVENVTANSNYYGIYLYSSGNNNLTGNSASDNSRCDIYIEDSSSTFTDSTLTGTTVSFTYSGNVSLKGEASPAADPSGQYSIGKFIKATNLSAGAWLNLNFSYSTADVNSLDESSLKVWKYNYITWLEDGWNGTRYLNTTNNIVGVNITNFSIFAPMAPAAAGSNGGGSSSGGVIGVGSSDEPENVEETVYLRVYLRTGDTAIYNFNNVVTSVEVTPDRTYGLVAARIEVLAGKPGSIISDPPAGVLFKYVNVNVGTTGWSEGKFSGSVINFKIPASWFKQNNIDPATITMYRHHDGEWQPLKTTMSGQAGGYYQYSSPTSGFSTFMILGQVEDSGTGKSVATTDSGKVTDPTPTSEATSDKGMPGFEVLPGIMGILIVVYLRKR